MIDTGMNAQESSETLLYQQQQLIDGKRAVQMFPTNTIELSLPEGMQRTANSRGVFHFNPELISETEILLLSIAGRENDFLELGPYSKDDILKRVANGEQVMALIEYTPEWVEVRAVLACTSTVAEQFDYLHRTKAPGNIVINAVPDRA